MVNLTPPIIIIPDDTNTGQSFSEAETEISTDLDDNGDDGGKKKVVRELPQLPIGNDLHLKKGKNLLVNNKPKYKNNELVIEASFEKTNQKI